MYRMRLGRPRDRSLGPSGRRSPALSPVRTGGRRSPALSPLRDSRGREREREQPRRRRSPSRPRTRIDSPVRGGTAGGRRSPPSLHTDTDQNQRISRGNDQYLHSTSDSLNNQDRDDIADGPIFTRSLSSPTGPERYSSREEQPPSPYTLRHEDDYLRSHSSVPDRDTDRHRMDSFLSKRPRYEEQQQMQNQTGDYKAYGSGTPMYQRSSSPSLYRREELWEQELTRKRGQEERIRTLSQESSGPDFMLSGSVNPLGVSGVSLLRQQQDDVQTVPVKSILKKRLEPEPETALPMKGNSVPRKELASHTPTPQSSKPFTSEIESFLNRFTKGFTAGTIYQKPASSPQSGVPSGTFQTSKVAANLNQKEKTEPKQEASDRQSDFLLPHERASQDGSGFSRILGLADSTTMPVKKPSTFKEIEDEEKFLYGDEEEAKPKAAQQPSSAPSATQCLPASRAAQTPVVPAEPSVEESSSSQEYEQIHDLLKTIGLDIGVAEIGKLAVRTQERLHGKKPSSHSPDRHLSDSRRQESWELRHNRSDTRSPESNHKRSESPLGSSQVSRDNSAYSSSKYVKRSTEQGTDMNQGVPSAGLEKPIQTITSTSPTALPPTSGTQYQIPNYAQYTGVQMPPNYGQHLPVPPPGFDTYGHYLTYASQSWPMYSSAQQPNLKVPTNPSRPNLRVIQPIEGVPEAQVAKAIPSLLDGLVLPPKRPSETISDEKNEACQKQKVMLEREKLKNERDTHQKKITYLRAELESLRKQQGELLRKKRREKDGHKDPLLVEVNRLQDNIIKEITELRKQSDVLEKKQTELDTIAQILGITVSEKVRKADTKELPVDKNSRPEKNRSPDKSVALPKDSKASTEKTTSKSQKPTEPAQKTSRHFQLADIYEYYDAGNHWCKDCNTICGTLFDFFTHMHNKKHRQTLDPYKRPWATKSQKEVKGSFKPIDRLTVPAKGSEFLIPITGYFCQLCEEFFGDQICAEQHMKSFSHNSKYKKYVDDNPLYEARRNLDHQAGLAAVVEVERRRQSELKRKLGDKSTEEREEQKSKMAKREGGDHVGKGTNETESTRSKTESGQKYGKSKKDEKEDRSSKKETVTTSSFGKFTWKKKEEDKRRAVTTSSTKWENTGGNKVEKDKERAKEEKAKEERAKEEKVKERAKEERAREQKAKEEKAKEERAREEKAKEERAREEKAREERAREEKAREERAREEKAKEESKTQSGKQKGIEIKLSGKTVISPTSSWKPNSTPPASIPSQSKIRPNLPVPLIAKKPSNTTANKPAPLNTFLSIQSSGATTKPLPVVKEPKTVLSPEIVSKAFGGQEVTLKGTQGAIATQQKKEPIVRPPPMVQTVTIQSDDVAPGVSVSDQAKLALRVPPRTPPPPVAVSMDHAKIVDKPKPCLATANAKDLYGIFYSTIGKCSSDARSVSASIPGIYMSGLKRASVPITPITAAIATQKVIPAHSATSMGLKEGRESSMVPTKGISTASSWAEVIKQSQNFPIAGIQMTIQREVSATKVVPNSCKQEVEAKTPKLTPDVKSEISQKLLELQMGTETEKKTESAESKAAGFCSLDTISTGDADMTTDQPEASKEKKNSQVQGEIQAVKQCQMTKKEVCNTSSSVIEMGVEIKVAQSEVSRILLGTQLSQIQDGTLKMRDSKLTEHNACKSDVDMQSTKLHTDPARLISSSDISASGAAVKSETETMPSVTGSSSCNMSVTVDISHSMVSKDSQQSQFPPVQVQNMAKVLELSENKVEGKEINLQSGQGENHKSQNSQMSKHLDSNQIFNTDTPRQLDAGTLELDICKTLRNEQAVLKDVQLENSQDPTCSPIENMKTHNIVETEAEVLQTTDSSTSAVIDQIVNSQGLMQHSVAEVEKSKSLEIKDAEMSGTTEFQKVNAKFNQVNLDTSDTIDDVKEQVVSADAQLEKSQGLVGTSLGTSNDQAVKSSRPLAETATADIKIAQASCQDHTNISVVEMAEQFESSSPELEISKQVTDIKAQEMVGQSRRTLDAPDLADAQLENTVGGRPNLKPIDFENKDENIPETDLKLSDFITPKNSIEVETLDFSNTRSETFQESLDNVATEFSVETLAKNDVTSASNTNNPATRDLQLTSSFNSEKSETLAVNYNTKNGGKDTLKAPNLKSSDSDSLKTDQVLAHMEFSLGDVKVDHEPLGILTAEILMDDVVKTPKLESVVPISISDTAGSELINKPLVESKMIDFATLTSGDQEAEKHCVTSEPIHTAPASSDNRAGEGMYPLECQIIASVSESPLQLESKNSSTDTIERPAQNCAEEQVKNHPDPEKVKVTGIEEGSGEPCQQTAKAEAKTNELKTVVEMEKNSLQGLSTLSVVVPDATKDPEQQPVLMEESVCCDQ